MDWLIAGIEWMQQHPPLAGILFVLLVAGVMAVGIPGGNVLLLGSGFLFGPWRGAALVLAGLMLGAWLTHLLIFHTFGRWLDQRAGAQRERWKQLAAEQNAPLLIVPRLVPVIPFFLINVTYAGMRVPMKTYLVTTLLGLAPMAILLARIGSRFSEMDELGATGALAILSSGEVLWPLAGLLVITISAWAILRRRAPADTPPGPAH